ncbi:MAG: hypothetical protein WBQ86_11945 [Candidatus Binatus sp.]
MKDFFVYRTARGLIIPFVTLICVLLAGAGPARAAKNGSVEIGFIGVPPKSPGGVPNFQNVLLNVQSIRINPKASANPGNGKWQTIPVPPGIGGAVGSADLQIDLNTSQNTPQIFNTAPVRVDTYRIAQLVLDSQNPGTLIPNCPQASPIGNSDGCINYPIQLVTGDNLFVTNPGGGTLVSAAKGTVAPLILQVSMTIVSPPTTPGGAYTVSVTLSPVTSSVLGTVMGSVKVSGSGTGGSTTRIRKLMVTAEALGTNTPIASAGVQGNGNFTLTLPAAGGPASPESPLGFGTLYDLAVAGGADTYAAERLQPLYPGQSITVNPDFAVTGGQTLESITGSVVDGCVPLKPIVGATLTLLIPPDSNMSANCLTTPGACVAVATATTDNTGFFPLPGTITIPAAFNNVPMVAKKNAYVMQVTAPGYQPLLVQAIPGAGKNTGGMCTPNSTSTTFGPCDLALQTAYITGNFPITAPPSGQSTLVQVFAEDHDSNNIEGALPMPVTVNSSSSGVVPFTINVPPSVTAFDLFASTIDLYQGVVDPFQGHNIVAISNVAAPAACATVTAPTPTETINCVGHGSITGTVGNADLGTSVVLEKLDPDASTDNEVQITNSIVQNQLPNQSPSNNYAFCAPADTYQVQKFEAPVPVPSTTPMAPTPTPSPAGDPASVTIPTPPLLHGTTPTPTSSPTMIGGQTPTATPTQKVTCPTTCSNPDGSCPGICNNVPVEPL